MRKVVQKTRLILFLALGAIGTGAATSAANPPLGIVVVGQHALIGAVPITAGTSLFDGDSVSTQARGSLQIRVGSSQILLGENASLALRRTDRTVAIDLQSGSMRFSGAAGTPIEIHALGAIIRSGAAGSSGQIVVLGPNEFQIGAISGSLTVNVNGDTRTVPEGAAYDATLDSPADPQAPVPTAKRRQILYWIIIPLIAFGTFYPVYRATMSPSKPN